MAIYIDIPLRTRQAIIEEAGLTVRREAERVIKREYFDPAVEQMKQDFLSHPVTEELKLGAQNAAKTPNISGTLEGDFKLDGEDTTTPNLFSFIGFNEGEDPTVPIEEALNSRQPGIGPTLEFKEKQKNDKGVRFVFQVSAPDENVIYNDTPMPGWDDMSWAYRIEHGIPGIGFFLNAERKNSLSGGGIQVRNKLRGGRFRPVSYLTTIFKDFLRRATPK